MKLRVNSRKCFRGNVERLLFTNTGRSVTSGRGAAYGQKQTLKYSKIRLILVVAFIRFYLDAGQRQPSFRKFHGLGKGNWI